MTSCRVLLTVNIPLQGLLSQSVPFSADPDCIVPQLGPEDLLYHQDGQKCFNVYEVEQPLESPAHPLPGDSEGLVNLLAVGALENHVTGAATPQFHPEIL